MFIVLLSSIVNASNHTKCNSFSNQKYMIQPALINLRPNEYTQELYYYSFAVKLDRCAGSCNTLNLNLSLFNLITGINESKTLKNHISCECKCKFDRRNFNSEQYWNNDKYQCECKRCHLCENDYVWNPDIYNCENGKYLASIMDDSTIMCDEIIELYKEETNFNGRKAACKTQNFYILLTFLLITIALLIAVSIYCYLTKYQGKQKTVLPFHNTNNQLEQVLY